MTTRRLFLAKLAGIAGFTLLSKAKGDYTIPLSLPVVVPPIKPLSWAGKSDLRVQIPLGAIDYDRLLYCISEVETGHKDHLIGPSGERSRYQIKRSVWEQHWGKARPFARCRGEAAWGTARDHLRWLEGQLGLQSSAMTFAFSWKEGLDGYHRSLHSGIPSQASVRGHSYAMRIWNLFNDPTYKHT
jgi:hypothetical protein